MQADERGAAQGQAPVRSRDAAELATLRATCHRQATAMETMTRVIADLRQGARALRAENAEPCAVDGTHGDTAWMSPAYGSRQGIQARLPLDAHAPRAARIVVAHVLAERVAAPVLARAQLVMSELVTNSVRHSGAPADAGVVVRVQMLDGGFWLEVEDPGRTGAVAQHAANLTAGGGYGLHIVQALSERWGVARAAVGGTRAWARLSDTAPPTGPDYGERGEATLRPPNGRATQSRGREQAAGPGRANEVHVIPQERTSTWGVYVDDADAPLSEHTSETEAESAARAHARVRCADGIVVHDRYHRIHVSATDR